MEALFMLRIFYRLRADGHIFILAGGLILLAVFFPAFSSAQSKDYCPLSKEEMGVIFKMKKARQIASSGLISFPLAAGPSGSRVEGEVDSEMAAVVSGKDIQGRPWKASLFEVTGCMLPVDFFEADLDGNGITDLVVLRPTCGAGLSPTMHLVALTFDKEGRPLPFEADGYFEAAGEGVDFLVDMDRDGKAELVYMSHDGGYWITNIYGCENGAWRRLSNLTSGKALPLYTRFTQKPNKKLITPPDASFPFWPDLSTDHFVEEGRLSSFRMAKEPGSEGEWVIEKSSGGNIRCFPSSWHDSVRVILDSPEGRRIGHFSGDDEENISALLQWMVARRLKVRLYGQTSPEGCRPALIWGEGK